MAKITTWQGLVRYYHVLLSRLGMSHDDGSAMIRESYGVEHLNEMTGQQLRELCNLLDEQLKKMDWSKDTETKASDIKYKLQRQVKAACGNLLAVQGKIAQTNWGPADWQTIIGTICNASGKQDFQTLSPQQLRALSFEFNKQRKAIEAARQNTQQNS